MSHEALSTSRVDDKLSLTILMSRIGTIYPNISSDFDMADCPEFWRNRTIQINLMNLKDGDYPKNIKKSAFIAIGLDLFIVIGFAVRVLLDLKKTEAVIGRDELGPFKVCRGFGKFKLFLTKFIFLFEIPLIDTCTGEKKCFHNFFGVYLIIIQKAVEGVRWRFMNHES